MINFRRQRRGSLAKGMADNYFRHQRSSKELTQQFSASDSVSIYASLSKIFTPVLADVAVTIFIVINLISIALPYDPTHLTKTIIFIGLVSILLYQTFSKMALPALKQSLLDAIELNLTSPVLRISTSSIQYRGQWQVSWSNVKSIQTASTVSTDIDSYQHYIVLEVSDCVSLKAPNSSGDRWFSLLFRNANNNNFSHQQSQFKRPFLAARVDSLKFDQDEIKACLCKLWMQANEKKGEDHLTR